MLLKKKYNFNNLIKQKRFLPLDPSVFYHYPASVFNLEEAKKQKSTVGMGKKENLYPNKTRKLKESTLKTLNKVCLLYTSPSPRDRQKSRMPSSA